MKKSGKLFRLFALLCSFLLPILFCPGMSVLAQEPGFSLHLFSFGKADAFLLMTEEGTVLIDSGESGQGKEILNFLEEKGITEIDTLILTHFDKDHVGGAAKVLKGIPVRRVLQSNCPRDSKEYNKYLSALALCRLEPVTIREPLSFSLGDVDFTVYPPAKETYSKDPSNNSSLATTVRYGDTTFLFTGDAESARLKELTEADLGHFTFLQVPHHGSWQTQLAGLLENTCPEVAVITSSEEEPEDFVTVQLLGKYGTEVLLTREGEIELFSDGSDLTIVQNGETLPALLEPAA